MRKRTLLCVVAVVVCGAVAVGRVAAAEAGGEAKKAKWAPAVKPKALSENVKRGLGWLVEQQLASGAWGQGEESLQMGRGLKLKDIPSIADTSMACLALVRSGSTPSAGPHARSVLKAVDFINSQVEKADKDSLFVSPTRGTRVQSKLGVYIDTFMASMLLSEVQDNMPDEKANDRVASALDKVLHKMQKNQRKDGTWDRRGWANTLAQSVAVKGLNRATQGGATVDGKVLALAADESRARYSVSSGKFSAGGSAGVELYAAASALSGQQDADNTNAIIVKQARAKLKTAKTEPERTEALALITRINDQQKDLAAAKQAVVKRLADKRFVAGFGSNGGEEFLSYMNIGESLVVKGGDAWKKWDKSMTTNLNHIQNKDGSWTGHHCITGRTFCTSAALLVLMVDRAPVPLAAKIRK